MIRKTNIKHFMNRFLKILFINTLFMLMVCLVQQSGLSADEGKVITGSSDFEFFYLEDAENRLTVNNILLPENQSRFIKTEKNFFHFNHRQSWHWIRIHPAKDTDLQNLLLEISEAKLESVNFYFKDAKGNWQVFIDGYSAPRTKKFKQHYFPVFPLSLNQPGSDFYLQVKGNLQPVPVRIMKQDSFEEHHLAKNTVYGIYIGFILFIIVNNLILGMLTKSAVYLIYVVAVIGYGINSLLISGYSRMITDIDCLRALSLNSAVNLCVMIWYAKRFLGISVREKTGKYLLFMIFLNICVGVMTLMFPPSYAFFIIQWLSLYNLFSLAFAALISIRKKRKFTHLYLYAVSAFTFFGVLEVLYINTGSPSYFFVSHVEWSWFSEVSILAYALNRKLEYDKTQLEIHNRKVQSENLHIITKQNEILEKKVRERTEELLHQNARLKSAEEKLNQNIKELMNAQETVAVTLAQNEAVTAALNNSAIVSLADLDGNIIKVNSMFCSVSGYSEEELIGKNHRIVNSGFHSREFWSDMWRTVTSGTVWRSEVCNRTKAGELYWVDTVINPVYDKNDKIIQYISIRSLMTERKKQNRSFSRRSSTRIRFLLQFLILFLSSIRMEDFWSTGPGEVQIFLFRWKSL